VAQSLAAHGGSPQAATLTARRVTRIAVHPARQREGIGQALIATARQQMNIDYLSVSFGYTGELWRFWQRCGFILVRIGSHREASSGCYTAMAMLPLSAAGQNLCQREHQRLCRDASVIERWNGEKIPVVPTCEATLNDDDWLDLAGFAFAHRPLSAAMPSLTRLLQATDLPLSGLRGKIEQGLDDSALSRALALSGRKAVLSHLRTETGQVLAQLDSERCQTLRHTVLQWQFFQ